MAMYNMPLREVKQRCAVFNCEVRRKDGEYRVIHTGWKTRIEAKAYYTDDADDAIGTARALDIHYKAHGDN